ncbi:hypothetical protein KCU73_g9897, partial [Aureobasidium melanogenum]
MLYRYPLPRCHYRDNYGWSSVAYDSDYDVHDSDDDNGTSTTPDTMIANKPVRETNSASPDQSNKGHLTKITDNSVSSSMLALPAEIMFKIFQDPSLFEDDLANLRLVCKRVNLCATEAFAKERFRGGLRLNFSVQAFKRVAAICSSNLRLSLESVLFVRDYNFTKTCICTKVRPDYSAIRNIKVESPLSSTISASALKELLEQAKHLETFSFSTAKTRRGIHWHEQHDLLESYRDAFGDRAAKLRERAQVDAILSKLESDRLTELHLADIIFTVSALKTLLERHRGTVRKLSIRGCRLRSGSCVSLLSWISQNLPCLEQIDLQLVFETSWGSFPPVVPGNLVTKVGKESIEAYITYLQKNRSHAQDWDIGKLMGYPRSM